MNSTLNKIFAALLIAVFIAGLSNFISGQIMAPQVLEEDAVPIEGAGAVSGSVAAKPKGPEPILDLIATADVARGEKLSKACTACHSFDKGGPNRVGPNQWELVGSDKGSKAGFNYSDAMKNKGGKWDYAELNKFLYKPKDYVPGTKMTYVGMKKPEDRAAIIAWLRTLSDNPVPLPSETDIAAEKADLSPDPEPAAPEVTEEEGSDSASTNEQTTEQEESPAEEEDSIIAPEPEPVKDMTDSGEDQKEAPSIEETEPAH
mgnify:CR=1 FL=1